MPRKPDSRPPVGSRSEMPTASQGGLRVHRCGVLAHSWWEGDFATVMCSLRGPLPKPVLNWEPNDHAKLPPPPVTTASK